VTFARELLSRRSAFLSGRIRLKPMSGLEVRGRRKTCGPVRFRRLVIRRSHGMTPRRRARMHGKVPDNPERGEAQGRIGVRPRWSHVGPQSGVEAQKSRPSFVRAIAGTRSSRRKSIGSGRTGTNDTWARSDRNVANAFSRRTCAARSLGSGIKPAKGREPQERRRTSLEGRISRPAGPREA
jgi:hypothetical protein